MLQQKLHFKYEKKENEWRGCYHCILRPNQVKVDEFSLVQEQNPPNVSNLSLSWITWSLLLNVQITLGRLRRETFTIPTFLWIFFSLLVWIWGLQTGQQIEWMTQQPSLKNCSPHRKRKSFNHTWIHWTANLSHCRAQFHSRWWWNVGQLLEQIGCVVLLRLNVFLLIKI